MVTTSTVPAVTAALVAAWQSGIDALALGGDAPVVSDGWNMRGGSRQLAYVGDVEMTVTDVAMGYSPAIRDELYTVEAVVWVAIPGWTMTEAKARAFTLLDTLEQYVALNPTLGHLAGVLDVAAATRRMSATWDDEGGSPECEIVGQFRCQAQIG